MNDLNYVCISGNLRSWNINGRRASLIIVSQDVSDRHCHPEILVFGKTLEKLQKMIDEGSLHKGALIEVFGSVLPCGLGRLNRSQHTAIVADDLVAGAECEGMEGENEFIFHGEIKSVHQLTNKLAIATIRMACDGKTASVPVIMDATIGIRPPSLGYAQLSGHILTRNTLLPISSADYTLERLHDYICTNILTA